MAEDWAANVRVYSPAADDAAIAGIVRHCGIALRKRDSSLVSMSDPAEVARVREGFLKKKLGLALPDAHLDEAIADVGALMKDETFKNRVTVYYLLAERFGALDLFRKGSAAPAGADDGHEDHSLSDTLAAVGHAAGAVAGAAVGAFAGSGVAAGALAGNEAAELVAEEVAPELAERTHEVDEPQPLAAGSAPSEGGTSAAWIGWVVLVLALIGLLWWLFAR